MVLYENSVNLIFDKRLHEIELIKLLLYIFEEEKLSQVLALKGETALYLFYNSPASPIDLDFEIIKPLSEKEIKEIHQRTEKICIKNKNMIKDSILERNKILLDISYSSRHRKIKVEIDISHRPFLSKWEVKSFLGTPIRVLKPEDMTAQKLVAVSTRTKETATARDIFDLWFMMAQKKWLPDKELVEKIAGKEIEKVIKKAIKSVESFPSSKIIQGIGELVEVETKKLIKQDSVKKQLLVQLRVLFYTFGKRPSLKYR